MTYELGQPSLWSCLLKVDTQSGGWEKCLTKMLKKIRGIVTLLFFTMHPSMSSFFIRKNLGKIYFPSL
ncbi:hypothetical protein RchiOBHm_Chr5g0042401 [Rosa chinensis]|uniref:Uncharacterized protein n=1 Tax=Rosa chinensis TaxID=74649 RepID=A0A2P6QD26_ROSCH|nr:hypothetical protein RchiOBHm_Chr5g0042401 [Rosa chinensis]